MPGHIKSINDYQVVEGTDIVFVQEDVGSKENIRDRHARYLMEKAGWPVDLERRNDAGKDLFAWTFYRASKGGNVWEDIESGDQVTIGVFEIDSTTPELDSNGNLLLKEFGRHLKSEGQNGNILINKDGRVIADVGGFGVIHHDIDGYGNYYAEIFKTRSSGGKPVTDRLEYAFFAPDGERIGGKNKSFERTETPSITKVKSKYMVAGASPYYIYDMGKNNAGRPEIYPNLAEMLISSMSSNKPFIKTPTQYIDPLFERQSQINAKLRRLQKRVMEEGFDKDQYTEISKQLTDELEAIDIAIKIFERDIASGKLEPPEMFDDE